MTRLLTDEKLRCDMGARARVWATARFGCGTPDVGYRAALRVEALARGLRPSPTRRSAA